LWVRFPPSAL